MNLLSGSKKVDDWIVPCMVILATVLKLVRLITRTGLELSDYRTAS